MCLAWCGTFVDMTPKQTLRRWSLSLLLGIAAAEGPFLTQIDNQTWVFGNDLWNVTEGANYATKLYSTILPGEDLVGSAWGHYSDVGTSHISTPSVSVFANMGCIRKTAQLFWNGHLPPLLPVAMTTSTSPLSPRTWICIGSSLTIFKVHTNTW